MTNSAITSATVLRVRGPRGGGFVSGFDDRWDDFGQDRLCCEARVVILKPMGKLPQDRERGIAWRWRFPGIMREGLIPRKRATSRNGSGEKCDEGDGIEAFDTEVFANLMVECALRLPGGQGCALFGVGAG
jgi:hypothetical protein